MNLKDIAFIASHGQTIVVSNFRAGDIAAGGNGAPLIPYVDYIFI